MLVTIHQPEHLPWLGFIDKTRQADLLVLLDDVPFRKNYFQNRNRLRAAQGLVWITVPVLTKGRSSSHINEIEINNAGSPRWREKCWETIEQNYRRAAYWDTYSERLRAVYERDWERLVDLNESLLELLLSFFCIHTPMRRASTLHAGGEKSEHLLQICQAVGATRYLSGISGKEYLDLQRFSEAGIEVSFQEFHHPVYRQLREPFLPLASSLDLVLTHGTDSPRILMGKDVPVIAELFE